MGNLAVLKVSYLALVLAPVLAAQGSVTDFLGLSTALLAALYFASLSLALANLIYDLACPVIIKRFASTADLYRDMLSIRLLANLSYPEDNYDAQLAHAKNAYKVAEASNPFARRLCALLYLLSAALFLVLFSNRTWLVLSALVESNNLGGDQMRGVLLKTGFSIAILLLAAEAVHWVWTPQSNDPTKLYRANKAPIADLVGDVAGAKAQVVFKRLANVESLDRDAELEWAGAKLRVVDASTSETDDPKVRKDVTCELMR